MWAASFSLELKVAPQVLHFALAFGTFKPYCASVFKFSGPRIHQLANPEASLDDTIRIPDG